MFQRLQKLLSKKTPARLWTIFILILMAIPGNMLPREEKTFIPNLDKLVHATLFGSFVFLWSIYYATRKEKNNHSNSRYVLILIIACLYGVATELMQKYLIPNRDYDIYDIMADSIGAVLGFLFVLFTVKKFESAA
ncbi:MAG TPA: VanZ family protein [Puia sp.]|jgi:VanZ family protein|nr:VanZ family protein [Puia sp.]